MVYSNNFGQTRVGVRVVTQVVNAVDADATAFIASAGITDLTQAAAISTLVDDLKAYGIWSKMKALYPFVGGSATSHKFNLKDPRDLDAAYRLVFNGGWVHSSNGALPNGTTGYANTYYNPSSLLNPFIGYYSRSNTNTNTDQIDMGCSDGTKWLLLSSWYKTTSYNNILARNSSPSVLLNGGIQSDSRGWYWTNKISNVAKLGRNSNILTTADDNINPPNSSIGIGAMVSSNIYANYYSNRETVFSVIADGLTDTETSNLYIAIQKFQTTLGRHVGTPYVSDPDAIAFLMAAGITDGTQAAAINTLVIRMKADGVWTKMKAIYPFVGGSAASHKFNLKDPRDLDAAYRLVFTGGWTHTGTGAKPNGTTGYYSTSLNPSNALSTNNVSLTVYLRTDYNDPNGVVVDFGTPYYGGNVGVHIYARSTNIMYVRANSYPMSYTNNDSLGLHGVSRLDGTNLSFIKNYSFSTTGAQSFSNSNNIIYGAYGGYGYYSPREHSFASIGDGLTSIEASNLYSAVQAFQTTLGRQVNVPLVSDTDAQAFLNAANITSFQQASAVNKLVVDLKAAGVWTKMKAIYPFVGGSAASHKFNLKDPRDLDAAYRLVFNGGWTHTSTGAQPNGTTGYADTKLNENSVMTLGSQHISFYSRTNVQGLYLDMGIWGNIPAPGYPSGYGSQLLLRYTWPSTTDSFIGYSTDGDNNYISNNDSRGFFMSNRTSNSQLKLQKNSTINTFNSNVISKVNLNFYIGARNIYNSTSYLYSPRESAFASIGDGLTDAEATAFYTAVQTYQTSLGRAVNTPVYNNGLVLNLDAGNANSYPGTGTTWFDLAAGNNGTLFSGVTYENTNSGGLTLNGSNQYISSFNNTNLNFTTSDKFTISCYFKATSTPSTFLGLVVNGNASGEWSYGIWVTNSKIQVGTHNNNKMANSTIVAGQIYQVTLTYSNNTMIVYLNGVNDGTFTSVSLFNGLNQQLVIGRKGANAANYFPGTIYNVQIYNRDFSATEVLNNFNSTRGRFGL